LLSYDEYNKFWTDIGFEPENLDDELTKTLATHVLALMDRLDTLPYEDFCSCCGAGQCACAYDHPEAVCMVHKK